MTKLQSSSSSAVVVILSIIFFIYRTPSAHAIGSGGTLAISYGSATVCGIIASQPRQSIQCYRRGQIIPINPNVNFSSISGGQNFFCGLRSGGYSLLCWDTTDFSGSSFDPQRVYFNDTVVLGNLSVGNNQVCATVNGTGSVNCWRGDKTFRAPSASDKFVSISSGIGFSCGILRKGSQVRCWGSNNATANLIQREFGSIQMASIVAGGSHVCGLNSTGFVFCKGNNYSGQLNVPSNSAWEFSTLALGANHSCGIRGPNYSVVCWGGGGEYSVNVTQGVSFATIASGSNFTCGLTNGSFSITCWGPGWAGEANSSLGAVFPAILPGPCDNSSCSECGLYPESQYLCSGFGNICKPCFTHISTPPPPPPPPPLPPPPPPLPPPLPMPPVPLPLGPTGSARPSPSKGLRKGLLAFCIVGSVGIVAGICTIVYCFWTGVCLGKKKVHNSVQPTIARAPSSNNGTASNNSPPSRSSTIRRPGSLIMRRQRSGTSTTKHADRAEEFSLAELAAATNSFSLQNKLGAGSFGIVYRGKLSDGREVAIKRGETGSKTKKFQEKESAFDSELAFLSRLHHKHLVRLVGYCEEKDEKLLVYDYMKNGALYDHIHDKNNVEKSSGVLNSWRMRIKVALDAARGIEYLHNYAVPSIIHRDIKSSNILLDANWTARVSDFGLSLMGPESDSDYRPTKAAGTVGYIDPEYYGLNLITAKSDVYGLGIVLLELLTGKRAIFRNGEDGGTPVSVVDFAVPAIMAGEMAKILDSRVGPPEVNEVEAVELMAYTALHCVNLEGKDRPTMADIVTNLDRALATCDFSHGSISSSAISIVLE